MKTKLSFFLVFLFSTSFLYSQQFEKYSNKELISEIKCYSSGKIEDFHVPARNTKSSKEPTAVFEITYTGFSDEAKAAFQAAADIWSYLISSPVPITIDARWEVMEPWVLGLSGSPEVFKNFKNAPFKDTWYKPTIANRLSGYDLNPEAVDMITKFNSNFNWYLGTDGAVPSDQTDFVTIVLHEIAHSLGFNSNAYKDGINGSFVYYYNEGGISSAFDHFMHNASGELLIDSTLFENPSPELLTEFTSNDVFFDSPLSNAANGGTPAELYAPSMWNPGSSISHLAEKYNGTENALMTYSLGTGESEHDPGSIVMGILAEQGWVSVRFEHNHLKDIETWSSPITVSAEIYADTALYDNSVFLHYSTDNFATETKVSMTTLNDTLFTFDIPFQVTDTLWYYIEAKSKLDRYYFYPSQGEGLINATFIDSSLFFVISDSEIPTAPTSLTTTEITDSTISLTWQPSTDNVEVTAYEIYKDNVLHDQTADTTYRVIGLSAATNYSFYIKAKDAADNLSEPSNTVSPSTTDSEIPTAPTSLSATEITDSTISLIWSSSTDNVEVSSYIIYKNNVLLDEVTDTIYIATELTTATTYSFFVKAKDAADNISEASNTINPSTKNTVGINMFSDNSIKYFKIYPNPNNGYFNMEFESDKIISKLNISIYGIDSKLVYSSDKLINDKFIKEQINVKNMNTGIYLIKLNTGKKIITERLLIK